MADRSIVVRLRAEVDGFKSAMAQATKATEQVGKGAETAAKSADTSLGRMVKSAQNNRQAWDQAGGTLTAFGAASVGALGLATKAAMDWESSWAGVQKTVDGTAPQMAALEQGLRGLARELPASHAEIAAVAEAAGQLGIETPNVLGFTRTMIDMGEATNLSAEEAATSLARFMNVMGTSQTDVGRLGASVVGLGNNFATTESEIVAMGQRLSGAAAQANMTEGDVLGMAAAMSSVGIEAEAGGSAMSQTMKRIGKSVDEGGASLDLFAQVSGMTAQQFTEAWQSDPAMALDSFITGLSGVEDQGMTTNGVLTELGITGIRESDSLLRLSAASGQGADGMSLLAEAVQMGNQEFDKGSALVEEAAKRYETAESRIQIAKNALVDFGISAGGVILPALAELADSVGNVAGWFADLPGPVLAAVTALGGIAGAGSLAAGSFLLIFPRVMETVQAFKTLKADMPGVAGGLGKVAGAVAVTTAAFAGVSLIAAYGDSLTDFSIGANEAADMATKTADAIDPLQTIFAGMGEEAFLASASAQEMGDTLGAIANGGIGVSWSNFSANIANAFGANVSTMEDAKQRLEEYGQGLAGLAQTDLPQAQAAFSNLWDSFGGSQEAGQNLLDLMPALRDELVGVASAAGLATDDATLLKIATGEIAPVAQEAGAASGEMASGLADGAGAAEEQASALTELQDVLQETANAMLGVRGSARDMEAAFDDAMAAAEENGKTLDITTEKGRANEAALDGIVSSTQEYANAMEESGASAEQLDSIMSSGRDNFIATAEAMGMSSEEASRLADELQLIPDFVETEVNANVDEAAAAAEDITGTMLGFAEGDYDATVGADTEEGIQKTYGFEEVINGATADKTANVDANVQPAMEDIYMLDAAIADSGGSVTINGNATPGNNVLNSLMGIINSSDGTVTIDGQSYPANQALGAAIDAINRSDGTVTIKGNNNPANNATDAAKRKADGTTGTMDVAGNNFPAGQAITGAKSQADNTTGTISVNASTSGANEAINNAARNRTSTIFVRYSDPGFKGSGGSSRFATGGAVYGPGTGTSDSIPALLSNGEHVLTAREVAMAGGQDAVFRMREAIRGGLRFANGGGVERGGYAQAPAPSPIRYQPVNTGAGNVAAAVNAAMSSWQPMVNIGGREFSGLMMQGNQRIQSMGGRR